MRKFSSNAYEIELPEGVGISPIFNAADLYLYKGTEEELLEETTEEEDQTLNWKEQMPKTTKKEVEAILEKIATKKTRGKTYYQYLVKWKEQPVENASWMTATELQKFNADPKTLMDQSNLPRESDAGTSRI